MSSITIAIKRLPHGEGLDLPEYAIEHSAGMDLLAAVPQPVLLTLGQRALIPTGIAIALPEGYEAQVRPRSGLALKNGITVLNSPGTIDSGFVGEIGVILINHGERPFIVERGMRIAQLVVGRYTKVSWDLVDQLPETVRGAGGFGSTGHG